MTDIARAIELSKERTKFCRTAVGAAIQRTKAAGGIGSLSHVTSGSESWPGAKTDERKAIAQYGSFRDIPFTAIRPIAVKIASLPLRVGNLSEEQKMDGQAIITKEHTSKRMLSRQVNKMEASPTFVKSIADRVEMVDDHQFLIDMRRPNPIMDRWSLFYCTAVSMYVTGRSYWWVERVGGKKNRDGSRLIFWYLPTTWVQPEPTESDPFAVFRVKIPGTAGEGWPVDGKDMVLFSFPDPQNPIASFSPLQAHARPIDIDDMIQHAQLTTMRDAPQPKIILHAGRLPSAPGMGANGERPVLTPNQRGQLVAAIKMAYSGAAKSGEPFIIDGLIENITPFGRGPAEMDFTGSSGLTKARIMEGLGVNPIVTGQVEGANRASATVADVYFYQLVINPLATLMSEAMTYTIAPKYEEDKSKPLLLWLEEAQARDPDLVNSRVTLGISEPGIMTKGELRHYIETGEIKIAEKDDDDEPTGGAGDMMDSEQPLPVVDGQQQGAPPSPDDDQLDDDDDDDFGAWDSWKSGDPLDYIRKGIEIGKRKGFQDATELFLLSYDPDQPRDELALKAEAHYDRYRRRDGKFGNAPNRAPDNLRVGGATEEDPGLATSEARGRKRGGGKKTEQSEEPEKRKTNKRSLFAAGEVVGERKRVEQPGQRSPRSMTDLASGQGDILVEMSGRKVKDEKTGKSEPSALARNLAEAFDAEQRNIGPLLPMTRKEGRRVVEVEESIEIVGKGLADEVEFRLKNSDEDLDWYKKDVDAMMTVLMEEYPEIKDNPKDASILKFFAAIMSNGQSIDVNLGYATDLYDQYKQTSSLAFIREGDFNGGGARNGAILAAFDRAKKLIDDLGEDGFIKFMAKPMTVKELRDFTGFDNAMHPLPPDWPCVGAHLFGPKIGSFFSNLNGNYDLITVDMWYSRSVHRHLGDIAIERPVTVRKGFDTLAKQMANMAKSKDEVDRNDMEQLQRAGVDVKAAIAELRRLSKSKDEAPEIDRTNNSGYQAARILSSLFSLSKGTDRRGRPRSTFGVETPARAAAKNLMQNLDRTKDSPGNAAEWKFFSKAQAVAQKHLVEAGIEIDNADFQAALWGFEKDLWRLLGYKVPRAKLTNYSSAAKKWQQKRRGE